TGDTIVFDSLTRLGRSMNDVLEEFRYFEQQRINLQFIKEPFINVNYNGESTNDVIQNNEIPLTHHSCYDLILLRNQKQW
ncbi:recombinase family protein, partial [Escherichia sp. R-CC3]